MKLRFDKRDFYTLKSMQYFIELNIKQKYCIDLTKLLFTFGLTDAFSTLQRWSQVERWSTCIMRLRFVKFGIVRLKVKMQQNELLGIYICNHLCCVYDIKRNIYDIKRKNSLEKLIYWQKMSNITYKMLNVAVLHFHKMLDWALW